MPRFMKFNAIEGGSSEHSPVWLDVYSIEEVRQTEPRHVKDDKGKFVKAGPGQLADSAGWLISPQVELALHGTHRGAGQGGQVVHAHYTVDGDADEVVAEIEKLIDCDRQEPEDDGLKITDRGVWLPGESYQPFDMVSNPEDVAEKFMALKTNKSLGSLVLRNHEYWCRITQPTKL